MKKTNEALRTALRETVEILEANTLLDTCLGFDGSPCHICTKEKAVIAKARAALKLVEKEKENTKAPSCVGCSEVQKHGVHACEKCGE